MNNVKLSWMKPHSILPLVFDDSISYYEFIAKLTYTVNQLISLINTDIDENIKNYINETFDKIMMSAIYDESTETIILKKGE